MSSFVPPHDPILRKVAISVNPTSITSARIQTIIEKMHFVAYGEQREKSNPILVGLAAPQIGISKRIVLVDVQANGKGMVGDLRVYINPEIVWSSIEKHEWYEGCYSTDRVCGIVRRTNKIKVCALNEDGEKLTESHEGYVARIFQHEIDHLNGKEFVSHISNPDHLHWVEEDQFVDYRNNEAWRDWPRKCSFEKWENIKRGKFKT